MSNIFSYSTIGAPKFVCQNLKEDVILGGVFTAWGYFVGNCVGNASITDAIMGGVYLTAGLNLIVRPRMLVEIMNAATAGDNDVVNLRSTFNKNLTAIGQNIGYLVGTGYFNSSDGFYINKAGVDITANTSIVAFLAALVVNYVPFPKKVDVRAENLKPVDEKSIDVIVLSEDRNLR